MKSRADEVMEAIEQVSLYMMFLAQLDKKVLTFNKLYI